MGNIAITGSASGIGAATRKRFEAAGHTVSGVDLKDAEVTADLTTDEGRQHAVDGVLAASGGTLNGLVTCAGIGPGYEEAMVVSLNYFGTVSLLGGLREALTKGEAPAAVAISSNSTTIQPMVPANLVEACLSGDEAAARNIANDNPGYGYPSSKTAVAHWVRRHAPTPEWAGAGIRLNAVAPGATLTPLLQASLDDPNFGESTRNLPVPTGEFATPDDIAGLILFLMGPDARFMCGSIVFVDGGTDALIRPDDFPYTYTPTEAQITTLLGG